MYFNENFVIVKRKVRKNGQKTDICTVRYRHRRESFFCLWKGREKGTVFVDIIWWAWYKKLKKTAPGRPVAVRKKDYARKRGNVK